jgi:hypothetical protein
VWCAGGDVRAAGLASCVLTQPACGSQSPSMFRYPT